MADKITCSEPEVDYYVKGGVKRISIDVSFSHNDMFKTVSGRDPDELKLKVETLLIKWEERLRKDLLKEEKNNLIKFTKELSFESVNFFKLGEANYLQYNSSYKIDSKIYKEVTLVNEHSDKFKSERTLNKFDIDEFVFSGKYNSVIGPRGLKKFMSGLQPIKSKSISQVELYNLVLESGVFIVDDYLLDSIKSNPKFKNLNTSYRYLVNLEKFELTRDKLKTLSTDMSVLESNDFKLNSSNKIHLRLIDTGLYTSADSDSLSYKLMDQDLISIESLMNLNSYIEFTSASLMRDLNKFINNKKFYKLVG